MNKGLGWKVIVIVGTVLVFIYGIFGIPNGVSGGALSDALLKRINLGLDLKGGTHLILQVQVNDAVNVDSDNAIEVLKAGMLTAKINYAEITKPDPANHPEQILIKGVPPEGTSDLRSLVSEKLPEYDSVSGANNTWTVTMKPTALTDTKNRAVTQAIETIRNRIDQLGVSEPIIEEHGLGQYQILVQLPGIDDPGRVKDVMQSTAMLEIKQMTGGPYPSEQAALQDKGGVAPADSLLMSGQCANGPEPTWCFVSRVSAVRGKDIRDAQPSRDQNGQPSVSFTLSNEGGQRFYSFTSAHVGDSLAVVLDNKVREVANIK
ncbi:MAG TPA: protein translocase subunit SecD, partial [Terriglobales bacterium]|nr:protein translocase subunit SecD [Terriglobales bacterium]